MVGNSETESGHDGRRFPQPPKAILSMRALLSRLVIAAIVPAAQGMPAWAQDTPPFRIGMVAPDGTPAIEGLSTIKAAYAGVLGRPVEVIVARDYAALIEAHAGARIDYAVYSATAFAAASIRCGCVRAIVAPVADDGAIGIRSVLLRRPGSQTAGSTPIAVGADDSLAGRMAPLALHPEARDPSFRNGLVAAKSLSEAESAFVVGSVSGFFGWVAAWSDEAGAPSGGTVTRLRQAGMEPKDYSVDWQSPTIRFGPHAVRADLDEDSVERLVSLLTGGSNPELAALLGNGHGGGFTRADNDDYQPVVTILEATRE